MGFRMVDPSSIRGGKPSEYKSLYLESQRVEVTLTGGMTYVPIIAIDMGTTRSGIAFGLVPDPKNGKALEFELQVYPADSKPQEDRREKSETVLLIFKNGEDQIGGDALYRTMNDDFVEGHYARDFKMLMDVKGRRKTEDEVLLRNTKVTLPPISEGSPITLPLMEVVSRFLAVAGNIGFKKLQEYAQGKGGWTIERKDVNWVITVPAIWTDQARIFMREAVLKANLIPSTDNQFSSQVGICLEPEGATLQSLAQYQGDGDLKDKCVLIVDLGGGTADITFHRINSAYIRSTGRCELAEIEPPSGGPWGARLFDEHFVANVITPLVGSSGMNKFNQNPIQLVKYFKEYLWKNKNSFEGSSNFILDLKSFISLYLQDSIPLAEAVKNIPKLEANFPNSKFQVKDGKIRIPPDVIASLFSPILNPLTHHLEKVITSAHTKKIQISQIFLVGGACQNEHLKNTLSSKIQNILNKVGSDAKVICPPAPGNAIVFGAARFGFDSSPFRLRKARTNYGVDTYNRENPSKPFFSKLISKNEDLAELSKRTKENPLGPFGPVTQTQTEIRFSLYESDEPEVKHIDRSCAFITETVLPVNTSIPFENRQYSVSLSMDGPCLKGIVIPINNPEEAQELKWSSR